MAFWGIEVKPGSPYTHLSKSTKRRLHISQATLGIGSGISKSLVQCNVGDKYPVFLCALLPGKTESCGLDLEFEEVDDVVFSVIGPRSVHLTGYYLASRPQVVGDDDSESYGEDIANSENESDHGSEDDDYEDSFIDDGNLKDRPISVDSDDDETVVSKPKKNQKRLKKKFQTEEAVGIDVSPETKPVTRRYRASVIESDDDYDDELPLSSLAKEPRKESNVKLPAEGERREDNGAASDDKEAIVSLDQETTKGRDLKRPSPDETDSKEGPKTKKRKQEQKEEEHGSSLKKDEKMVSESKNHNELHAPTENGVNQPEMANKKTKKKKHKIQQDNHVACTTAVLGENGNAAPEAIKATVCNPNASQTRTLSCGLVIEEVEYGNEDGKVASQGKKVKINYTGKLKTGSVVESNSKDSPYKFRLGAGKVIKAWDIGIEGMRVGGKRRLTIPPALGYGSQGNGENIPPESWLVYDIELVSAR